MKKTKGGLCSPLKRLLALTLVFALLLPVGMAGTVAAAEPAAAAKTDPAKAPEEALRMDGKTLLEYTEFENEDYTKVDIPYGVERIARNAFIGAEFLEEITIPDTVTYIEPLAFADCIALREITIPGSVDTVGASAFRGCTAMHTVTLLYGVHSIEDGAFMGCTSLSKVTVSPSVNKFSPKNTVFADSGASGGIRVETNLKDNETQSGNSAAVEYINNLSEQKNIKVSKLPANSAAAYAYEKDANGKVTIEGYFGESSSVIVPETINGGEVTQIGDGQNPLQGNPVTKITLPTTLEAIGAHAFEGNKTIEEINIPEGVEEIPENAFKDSSISQVTLPMTLRTIGSNAFAGCEKLQFVIIPDSVTSIGKDAFDNSAKLTLSGSCKALWEFLRERRLIRFIPRGAGSSIFHKVKAEVTTVNPETGQNVQTNGGTLTEGDPENYFIEDEELSYTVQVSDLDTKIGRYEFEGWTITPEANIEGVSTEELLQKILGTGSADETKLALAKSRITIKVPEVNITLTAKIGFFAAPPRDPDIYEGLWSGDNSQSVILREYVGKGSDELRVGTFTFDDEKYVVTKIGQGNIGEFGYSGGYTQGMAFPNRSTPKIWICDSVDGILPQAFAKATGLKAFGVEGTDDKNGENCVGAHFKTIGGVLFSKDGTKLLAYPASKEGTSYTVPDGVTEIGAYAFYNCQNLTHINTNGVTKIGEYAFSGSVNGASPVKLQEVVMPKVTTIGAHAFEGARYLESIQFSQSVTDLGKYSFYNCSSLTHIEWAKVNDISIIPAYAFAGCNLSTLTLPNNGTDKGITIDDYAFASCKIENVTISKSIAEMKSNAFAGCSSLKAYQMEIVDGVEIKHPKFACLDGVLFNADMTTLMAYPIAKTTISGVENATAYQVPETVVTIGSGAFYGAKFEKITLGANTSTIEFGAFENSNLKDIDLSKVTTISSNVFQSCQNLESISWPDAVTTIGKYSFYNCPNLMRVTAPKVTTIEEYAFYYCSKLTEAPLHETLTSIGRYAFAYCTSLPEAKIPNVVFKQESDSANSDDYVFFNCTALKTAYLGSPDIPAYAFYGCSALETLRLSDTVKNINGGAFLACSSLKETVKEAAAAPEETEDPVMDLTGINVIAPYAFSSCRSIKNLKTGGTRIDAYAFQGCTGLVSAQIDTQYIGKGALAQIGDDCYAFSGCTNLANLELSNNVKSIGKLAFSGCNSLTEIHIPKNLTELGERAFNNCAKLESVTVDAENTVFETRDGSPAIPAVEPTEENPTGTPAQAAVGSVLYTKSNELYLYPQARKGETYTVADGVDIHDYAFEGAKNLTSVVVGSELSAKPDEKAVNLGAGLFLNCATLTDFYVYDPEADFGEKVGDGAYLTSLSSMPDATLRGLTVHGWLGSTAERATFVMSRAGVGFMPLESVSDGLIVTLGKSAPNYDGSASRYEGTITGYKGTDTTVIVTSLIDEAFMETYSNTQLIKDGQPYTLGTGESVTIKTVGSKAFAASEKEDSICAKITSIHLPESITKIESYAFENCSELTGTFSVPASTKTIEPYAFRNCDKLIEVRIPESVTVMGGKLKNEIAGMNEARVGMFEDCAHLQKITVDSRNVNFSSKDGVLMSKDGKIIYEAPQGLAVNGSYTIPEGVEVIECSAFAGNWTISTLTFPSTIKLINQHAFQRTKMVSISFKDNPNTTVKDNYLDIDNEAFVDCEMIAKITLPSRIKRVGDDAFKGCKKVQSFDIPNADSKFYGYAAYDGVLYSYETEEKTKEDYLGIVCFPMGKAEYEYTIPDTVTDPNTNEVLPVRVIYGSAFQGNTVIDKITIGKNVEWIYDSAFRNCTCLNEIKWSEREEGTQYRVIILGMAFSGTALTNFVVPEFVDYLGENSFLNCEQLKTVEVRSSGLRYGMFDVNSTTGYTPSDRVFGRKDERKLTDKEIAEGKILDENFTVKGYANSSTDLYCETHGLKFMLISDGATTYTIATDAGENGHITVRPESAIAGATVRFYLVPETGYSLDADSVKVVSLDGETEGKALTLTKFEDVADAYSFTMPAQNVKIKAAFTAKKIYQITVSDDKKDLVTVKSNVSEAYEGTKVTVTAVPKAGYQVDDITASIYTVDENDLPVFDGNVVVTQERGDTYTFTMPAGNVEIGVKLAGIKYSISLNEGNYGEVKVDRTSANIGDKVTVSPRITAEYGTAYEINTVNVWCGNNREDTVEVTNEGNGVYTFVMPASDVTVEPDISRLYSIKLNCGGNGTATLEPNRTIAKMDETITVIATPNEGYEVNIMVSETDNVTQNPIDLDSSNSFKMPESDVVINVEFYEGASASEAPESADLRELLEKE